MGENLPRVWHAATTTAAERKRLLRFIVREVALDQKRAPGQVWLKILWQTGATSEHRVQRRVHTYRDYRDLEQLRRRVAALNGAGKMDKEIATALNREGFVAARGCTFKGENVWLLRKRWGIATVKINGVSANPLTLARRDLLDPGRRGGARHHATDRLRLSRARAAERPAARQRATLADRCSARSRSMRLRARVRHTRRSMKEAS